MTTKSTKADVQLLIQNLNRIVRDVRKLAEARYEQAGMATFGYESMIAAEESLKLGIRQLQESIEEAK